MKKSTNYEAHYTSFLHPPVTSLPLWSNIQLYNLFWKSSIYLLPLMWQPECPAIPNNRKNVNFMYFMHFLIQRRKWNILKWTAASNTHLVCSYLFTNLVPFFKCLETDFKQIGSGISQVICHKMQCSSHFFTRTVTILSPESKCAMWTEREAGNSAYLWNVCNNAHTYKQLTPCSVFITGDVIDAGSFSSLTSVTSSTFTPATLSPS